MGKTSIEIFKDFFLEWVSKEQTDGLVNRQTGLTLAMAMCL